MPSSKNEEICKARKLVSSNFAVKTDPYLLLNIFPKKINKKVLKCIQDPRFKACFCPPVMEDLPALKVNQNKAY